MDDENLKRKKDGRPMDGEVKKKVIQLILKTPGKALKRDLLKYLTASKIVNDQSNLNRHLNQLYDSECIERFRSKIPKHPNKWDVTKFNTLKKIKYDFPEIQLNKYEKSLMIVLNESRYNISNVKGLHFYIELYRSASFFNACLETDIDTLRKRAWNVYLYDRGSETNKLIEKLMNELYYSYIINSPKFQMSKETFQGVTKEIEQMGSIDFEYTIFGSKVSPENKFFKEKFAGLEKIMSRDIFIELEKEVTKRRYESPLRRCKWNEKFDEEDARVYETIFIKICEELFQKGSEWGGISLEAFLKTMSEDRKLHMKMNEILSLIEKQRETFHGQDFGLQLKHFIYYDTLIGIGPDEEFEKKVGEVYKNFNSEFLNSVGLSYSNDYMSNLLSLRIASEFIFKYKQPKNLNISNDKDEILDNLVKIYELEPY